LKSTAIADDDAGGVGRTAGMLKAGIKADLEVDEASAP
jgi:hypothetical protein